MNVRSCTHGASFFNNFLRGAKSFDKGFATGFKGFFNGFFFFFFFLSVGFGFFLSLGFTSGFGFLSVTRALVCGVSSTPSPDAVRSASISSSSSSAAAVSSAPPGHAGLMKGTPPFSGGSPGRPGRLARLARLNMEDAGAGSSSGVS